ncbi:amidohydrolase family protein [Allosaccharopolyspora coralli]|uniref:Amidohydrolase family protein n=1 Tax=Allosaccharopolyspora coralli TaxID=2665642 RepID=A0A5Q3QBR1_9PSEU|nr:amidohydrolase family protein [Allosaccharopolyspora coralli]QGK71902.1 amidohydrolase family protein [Allosaccharopolyspora coralli]
MTVPYGHNRQFLNAPERDSPTEGCVLDRPRTVVDDHDDRAPSETGDTMALPKVALEEHFLDPASAQRILDDPDELARVSAGGGVMPEYYEPIMHRLAEFDGDRLATMDAHGVERAILSLTAPGVQVLTDTDAAVSTARSLNDLLADQVRRRPDRFSGFAAVPLQDPAAAASELRRCVRDLGFVGVMVNGYTNDTAPGTGRYYDEPGFEVFWKEATELGVPVYLHPRPPLPSSSANLHGHPELVGATWGFGTETATHALRLIFSGLFDRHPELQLVLGHLGEGLPAQLWRTQYCFDLNPFDKRPRKTLAEYFADNIHVTTSGHFSDQALISALLTVGADRILFSVDYPYAETDRATAWIENAPISESDRRKIAHGNARRLLRLPDAA